MKNVRRIAPTVVNIFDTDQNKFNIIKFDPATDRWVVQYSGEHYPLLLHAIINTTNNLVDPNGPEERTYQDRVKKAEKELTEILTATQVCWRS